MSALGARLREVPLDAWATWLREQRWFGAKATNPAAVRVGAVVPLEHEGRHFAIVRLDVEVNGEVQRYQLALRDDASVDQGEAIPPSAIDDPAFLRYLADALGHAWSAEGDGAKWMAVPAGNTPLVVPPDAPITLLGAEQSNTSIRFGDLAILKLFRRIEPGAHPDVEMTEFLTTRHRFPYTPTLLGTLVLEERGERTVVGMLQELVPSARDAWTHALEVSGSWFTDRGGRGEPPFVKDAARIGTITRAMHETLASDDDDPEFAPEPATGEDVEQWADLVRAQVEEAVALLERQLRGGSKVLPKEALGIAEAIVARREDYANHVEELVDEVGDDAGFVIRHHGDYHLGQLLHSAGDEYMIIDFEGEPARPLAQRRRKASPLRDVAGMLRSFAYAAATLASSPGASKDIATREVKAGRWERAVRSSFLDAYLAERDEAESDFLPEEPTSVKALLALFEMEKVFYELGYELNNRPSWSWIPMRGIGRVTGV